MKRAQSIVKKLTLGHSQPFIRPQTATFIGSLRSTPASSWSQECTRQRMLSTASASPVNFGHQKSLYSQLFNELESLSSTEFQMVTSSAVSFLTYFDLPQDSYETLRLLCHLIRNKSSYLKKDQYLNLTNDVYFHVHRNLDFKLPGSFVELRNLAESGYTLRLIERPYYRDLAYRWMHDVLTHLRPRLATEELSISCLDVILMCLIGLPKETKVHTVFTTDFHDHQTSMSGRSELLQEVFQVVRKNYDSLVNTTRWNLLLGARFLHMLYRQKFRVTVREDLDFIRTVIHDVVTNNNLENLDLVTILKVDRLYGTLGPEFFQYLMDALTHDRYAVYAQRVLKMDVLMRICYLLSEKPYACKFSFFFDQAIEHILREFYPDSKAKWISVVLLSCLKCNYKPPDVYVRRLCSLFMVSMKRDTYLEQLLNICRALVGLQMVHLGEDVVAQFLEWCESDSNHSEHISDVAFRQQAVILLKSLQVEQPDLIYKYCTTEGFHRFLKGCSGCSQDFTHFKVGFLSSYNSLLEEVLGKGNITGIRVLKFFQDIDHVFMIDNEGNILPAVEVQQTYEMIPESLLITDRLEPASLPEETSNTGISTGQPDLSQNDLRFALLDRTNSISKIWTKRPGHLIYLVLCSRNEEGVLYGVCSWQDRLMSLKRPQLNKFEIDHIYVGQVIEKMSKAVGDEQVSQLKSECIQYIQGVVDFAISETLKKARLEAASERDDESQLVAQNAV